MFFSSKDPYLNVVDETVVYTVCSVLFFLGGRLPCNVIVYEYEILFYITMYTTYTTKTAADF